MTHQNRVFLSSFAVVVGAALIIYGGFHRKKESFLTALVLGALVIVLAVVLPVPTTMKTGDGGEPARPRDPVRPGGPEQTLTEAEVLERVGYTPVQSAIDNVGAEAVVALWAPTMRERFKVQIQPFLHRTTGTPERPSLYRRGPGWLIVLEGTTLGLSEVEALVNRFGSVDEAYPNIRLLKIVVEGERLLDVTPELRRKLTDIDHPAFYARNQSELEHINLDRVEEAANRLADVEPLRFRPQISQRLVELVQEDADSEFKGSICRALLVWALPDDGSEKVVSRVAKDLLIKDQELPRSMIEFLIARKSADIADILEILWRRSPNEWEATVVDLGSAAETFAARHLADEDKAVRQSTVRILRRVGTSASLPALRKALQEVGAGGDDSWRGLLEGAIKAIESR